MVFEGFSQKDRPWTGGGEGSGFAGHHDGQHPVRYGRVGWVRRMGLQVVIVRVDLSEDFLVVQLDHAGIMLATPA